MLGIGAGWFEQEHHDYGFEFGTFTQRFERLEEALQIIAPMLRGEEPTFDGHVVQRRRTRSTTRGCGRRSRSCWVAAGEQKTFRLAARYADHMNIICGRQDVPRKVAALRQRCEEVGRDPATLPTSMLGVGRPRRVARAGDRPAGACAAGPARPGLPRHDRAGRRGPRDQRARPGHRRPDDQHAVQRARPGRRGVDGRGAEAAGRLSDSEPCTPKRPRPASLLVRVRRGPRSRRRPADRVPELPHPREKRIQRHGLDAEAGQAAHGTLAHAGFDLPPECQPPEHGRRPRPSSARVPPTPDHDRGRREHADLARPHTPVHSPGRTRRPRSRTCPGPSSRPAVGLAALGPCAPEHLRRVRRVGPRPASFGPQLRLDPGRRPRLPLNCAWRRRIPSR